MDYRGILDQDFIALLSILDPTTPALWGSMNAQQMVEHLNLVVNISNGRLPQTPTADPEKMAYRRARFFEKDVPMPRNFQPPFIAPKPQPLRYENMKVAIQQLQHSLSLFHVYFTENETALHPLFGNMNYDEWLQFHFRHFRHHFTQFGLIPEEIN